MYQMENHCGFKRLTPERIASVLERKLLYSFGNWVQWQAMNAPYLTEVSENTLGICSADGAETPGMAMSRALARVEEKAAPYMAGRDTAESNIIVVHPASCHYSTDLDLAQEGTRTAIDIWAYHLKQHFLWLLSRRVCTRNLLVCAYTFLWKYTLKCSILRAVSKTEGNRMQYKIIICDDSTRDVDFLSLCVAEWAKLAGHTVTLETFSSAEAFLFHYDTDKTADILLLDVEMPGISGVELAKHIRRENEVVQIVFITGYSDYIAEGYEVSALHYLMKPVDRKKFCTVLDRAVAKLESSECTLLLEGTAGAVRVPLREIRYLEVRQNYVTVHAGEDVTVKKTLGALEKDLDDRFFRIGRSFILNLTCIRRITKAEVHLMDGTVLPLPRGMYEALNRAVIERL